MAYIAATLGVLQVLNIQKAINVHAHVQLQSIIQKISKIADNYYTTVSGIPDKEKAEVKDKDEKLIVTFAFKEEFLFLSQNMFQFSPRIT